MTNANLPERWLNDRRFRRKRLSDAGYRSYHQALIWAVANRTDGVIERGDLADIPDFDPAVVPELMADDLWDPLGVGDRWLIHDYATTQSSKNLLDSYEKRLEWDRVRKAKAAKAAAEAKLSGGNSGGNSRNAKNRGGAELAELAGEADSGGNSTGTFPPESFSTNQTSTNQTPKPRRSNAARTNSHEPDA
jgi:hypothetical protein